MTHEQFIRIGFSNLVATARVIAIVSPDSSPVRRLIADARDRGSLIDATSGRKTRAVLIMDSDHLVLSALPAEDLIRVGGFDVSADPAAESAFSAADRAAEEGGAV